MATEDLIQARPSGDSFAKSSLDDPVEFWDPPLAPTGTLDGDDMSLRHALGPATRDKRFFKPLEKSDFAEPGTGFEPHRDDRVEFWGPPLAPTGTLDGDDMSLRPALGPATRGERFFKPLEKSDFAEPGTGFEPHRHLIAGTVILAVLGISALAFIWASTGEKKTTQSEQSAPAVQSSQSSPQPPAQTASRKPESLPDPSVAVAWPDVPASVTVETPEVAPVAPTGNTAPPQTVSASQKPDIVFLQRPGVNIRSAPSANGRVLGTAPKRTRFKVTNREGDWVQVESDRFRGWIKSQFLAANELR
jgi:hypothetical protein